LQNPSQGFGFAAPHPPPKRALTKPSEGVCNNGYDNEHSDLVLYVNDALHHLNPNTGVDRSYIIQEMLGQVGPCCGLQETLVSDGVL
jgi:hypothetical protein